MKTMGYPNSSPLKQTDFKGASGMIKFLAGSFLTRLPRKARAGRMN
jgi:hypothetical protein